VAIPGKRYVTMLFMGLLKRKQLMSHEVGFVVQMCFSSKLFFYHDLLFSFLLWAKREREPIYS
jgi:hypothetical protein